MRRLHIIQCFLVSISEDTEQYIDLRVLFRKIRINSKPNSKVIIKIYAINKKAVPDGANGLFIK